MNAKASVSSATDSFSGAGQGPLLGKQSLPGKIPARSDHGMKAEKAYNAVNYSSNRSDQVKPYSNVPAASGNLAGIDSQDLL